MATGRDVTFRVRLTAGERADLGGLAGVAGVSSSELVRFWLGRELGRGLSAGGVLEASSAEPLPAAAEVRAVPDLAERREVLARRLAATMPIANARMLAARELPE